MQEIFMNVGATVFSVFLVYLIRYTYHILGGE